MIAQLLAVAATTLTAGFLIPQILRLVRGGDTAGVSVTWAAFGVITNAAWVLYLGKLGCGPRWLHPLSPFCPTPSF